MKKESNIRRADLAEVSQESPEERARRVAEIRRRVLQGRYAVDSREILYNMLKTAP